MRAGCSRAEWREGSTRRGEVTRREAYTARCPVVCSDRGQGVDGGKEESGREVQSQQDRVGNHAGELSTLLGRLPESSTT